MEENSLEEKTSLSTQVGAPGPAAWASPPPTGGGTCSCTFNWHGQHDHHGAQPGDGLVYVFERLQACIRGYSGCLPPDLASCALLQEMRLKMDEDLEKRAIEAMPVVSSLRFHAADAKNKAGYRANLRCGCKQVGPVRMSSNYPTLRDCLRELGRVIQRDHGPTCVAAAQELQAAEKDGADASTKR